MRKSLQRVFFRFFSRFPQLSYFVSQCAVCRGKCGQHSSDVLAMFAHSRQRPNSRSVRAALGIVSTHWAVTETRTSLYPSNKRDVKRGKSQRKETENQTHRSSPRAGTATGFSLAPTRDLTTGAVPHFDRSLIDFCPSCSVLRKMRHERVLRISLS